MSVADIISPIIYGAVFFFILGWLFFIMYWIMKKTGMLKPLKKLLFRKKSPPSEIYVYVAQELQRGKKFDDIAQYISKFPKPIQDQYITAYLEIRDLKGGLYNG